MHATEPTVELPLFPLQAVLFPGGRLTLKIFEARYLDLIGSCLREQRPFGVVTLRSGHEVRRPDERVAFEPIGTLAELLDVDSDTPGILHVTCCGRSRFGMRDSRQRDDGLWLAHTDAIADDATVEPGATQREAVRGLRDAMASLKAQSVVPFLEPFRFDDAGWVANRWCELLPIPQAAKYKLMTLPDPAMRLKLVDDFLRSEGVIA